MSHLQKAFVAKNKAKMNPPVQRMSRALIEKAIDQKVHMVNVRKNPEKQQQKRFINNVPYWYPNHSSDYQPHLRFTLRK